MSPPLVSIIVRTHGGRGAFLSEALESVAAQAHRPIEVVVVEDGSSDCEQRVSEFASTAGIATRYRSIPKAGRCQAGNAGLALASGDLLNFLDDDDLLLPNHLSALVARLAEQPLSVAAYSRSLVAPTSVASLDPLSYEVGGTWLFRGGPFSRWNLWAQNLFPIQACLFRRSLYDQHGGLDESLPVLEDWELWVRYFSNDPNVTFIDDVTSVFRLPGDAREMRDRELGLASEIARVDELVADIEVAVTADDLAGASRATLEALFAESTVLSAAERRLLRGGLVGRLVFRAMRLAVASIRAGRGKRRDGSPASRVSASAVRLANAALQGEHDKAHTVTIRDARQALSLVWRANDPDRYALLSARNGLSRWQLHQSRPVLWLRARLGRDNSRPPGAEGPRVSLGSNGEVTSDSAG